LSYPPSADGDRTRSSPAARKRAQELRVDITTIAGSGPGGRVTLEDVEAAGSSEPVGTAAADRNGERREPLSRMRKAIAERMSRSWREAPQFSVSRDVDMTAANEARKRAGASYTDAIVAAAAKALAAHPRFRARFDGDTLVSGDGVHVGIAVAVTDGLLVPVVRDADRKDLAGLARERERLEQHAHAGKLTAAEMTGGIFSVSNLGTMGVDRFTAIVNPPEAAILAIGRVSDQVVARDGQPVVRPVATLTLSVDHRVADGAAAALFLDDIASALEEGAG
jgi:pyruvate dehydrogenase E2 component (dihydrolipoamide acetyltransferase)